MAGGVRAQFEPGPDAGRPEAGFSQRYGQSAVADVVGRFRQALTHDFTHRRLDAFLVIEVDARRQPPYLAQYDLGVLRAAETARRAIVRPRKQSAQQDEGSPRSPEMDAQRHRHVIHNTHHADHRRGVDALAEGLVVQADVAARNRRLKVPAGLPHPLDGGYELGHDLRLFRIAEVQAIGGADRFGSDGREVPAAFGNGQSRSFLRVERTVTAVAVQCHGQRDARVFNANHRGVAAWSLRRISAHHVVVLLVNPALGADVRGSEQGLEPLPELFVRGFGYAGSIERRAPPGFAGGPVVERRIVGQQRVRYFADHLAVVADSQQAVTRDSAYPNGIETPFREDPRNLFFPPFLGYQQHSFLGFREHDFVRAHAAFALRNPAKIDFDPATSSTAHLAGGAGQSGRAHVLDAQDGSGPHGLQTGLEQQLLEKRVADLDVGSFLFRLFVELGRGHRGSVDTVATCFRSNINHRVSDSRGRAVENLIFREDAERKGIDQRVAAVAWLEDALSADRGHAETVAVVGNAAHDALGNVAVADPVSGIVRQAETQGIHHRDGPRSHRKNVTQDAAYARSSALKRFDEARVVVRLDLESSGVPAADVHDPGVLSRSHKNPGSRSGQLF